VPDDVTDGDGAPDSPSKSMTPRVARPVSAPARRPATDADGVEEGPGDLTARLRMLEERISSEVPPRPRRSKPAPAPLAPPTEEPAEPGTTAEPEPAAELEAAEPQPAPVAQPPVKKVAKKAPAKKAPATSTRPRKAVGAPLETPEPADVTAALELPEAPAAAVTPAEAAPKAAAPEAPQPLEPARRTVPLPVPETPKGGRFAARKAAKEAEKADKQAPPPAVVPAQEAAAPAVLTPATRATPLPKPTPVAKAVPLAKPTVPTVPTPEVPGSRSGTPLRPAPGKTPTKAPPAGAAPTRPGGLRARPGGTPVKPLPVGESPVAVSTAPTAPLRTRPAVAAPPPPAAPLPTPAPAPRQPDRVVRIALLLTVLLLALAAGLGTAAFVEHRKVTWQSVAVVRLDAGVAPTTSTEDSISAGVVTYLGKTATAEFTKNAAQDAQVAASSVRGTITSRQSTSSLIALEAHASTAKDAAALASGAADSFVQLVNLDQVANQPSEGDRLSAAIVSAANSTTKTSPKQRDAVIAGALAALAVLVLSGGAAAVRLSRRS
jgi:hypothetical protein